MSSKKRRKSQYEKSYHRLVAGIARREEKEVKIPKWLCNSCTKCVASHCSFFNRHVDVTYNKCFYHSSYSPLSVSFRIPENLEEIIEREEKRIA